MKRGVAAVLLAAVAIPFLFAHPLGGSPDKIFEVWAEYTTVPQDIHIVGYENENVVVLTAPSIRFEKVKIKMGDMWMELKSIDAENFYMKAKYLETTIIILNLLPLSHLVINGSHVDEGIPLIGGLFGLQTCQTADAHLYPPLTWLMSMQNTYVRAEELRLSMRSENIRIRF